MPKQAQGYVVAGLAVLILMAVMFSKNHPRPVIKDATTTSGAVATDVNQQKIRELEQDLSATQRQQAAVQKTGTSGEASAATSSQPGAAPASQLPPSVAAQSAEPHRDPIADAEKAMAFKARFASNLVVPGDVAAHPPVRTDTNSGSDAARSANLPQAPAAPVAAASTDRKRAPEVNANSAHGQPFVVFEGTTIDTVLVNRLDGEFAGPVKVMVTNPVYSQDRQHMLIPEGAFILGDVQKVSSLGQKRLAVTFHRLLMRTATPSISTSSMVSIRPEPRASGTRSTTITCKSSARRLRSA